MRLILQLSLILLIFSTYILSAENETGDAMKNFDFTIPKPGKNELIVKAYGSHIDLYWNKKIPGHHWWYEHMKTGFIIMRSASPNGPFKRINAELCNLNIYSDFVGGIGGDTYYYKIKLYDGKNEQTITPVVKASTKKMSDDELLTAVELGTFRYFWNFAEPNSGLTRERYRAKSFGSVACASGGTGFGFLAIIVGTEREFVSREDSAKRVLKMVSFLQDKANRYHGAWAHWIRGETGETIPFGRYDKRADLVETALLMQGMLTAREYFDKDNPIENEIRKRVSQVWEEIEWDWFLDGDANKALFWHWSPNNGFEQTFHIMGFNECMIVYLLAIASPTHPIDPSCYYNGWASGENYISGEAYLGYKLWVGRPSPLFLNQYSFVGFDPRNKKDKFCNYFDNSRQATLINRQYCIDNPLKNKGYSSKSWGLTSSYSPEGYRNSSPEEGGDYGTIAPTAAISSMPFTPKESLEALKYFYYEMGDKIWGPFGFRDSFNVNRNWYTHGYLAIDQGPLIAMIENHRTGLCWKYFMKNPEIKTMMDKIGWKKD